MKEFNLILDEVKAKVASACARAGRDPGEVEIIAVTKTHGAEVVKEAWDAGLRIVGENKVQEAAWKKPASVTGPQWHLIGHLQSNKVRKALELFERKCPNAEVTLLSGGQPVYYYIISIE